MTIKRFGPKSWPIGTNNEKPFSMDGAKGMNLWAEILTPNGGTLTAKLQKQSPGGTWSDVTGVALAAISTATSGVVQVYPGIPATANVSVNGVLGSGPFRVVATVTGGAPNATLLVEPLA